MNEAESQAVVKIDEIATNIAQKMGMSEIPWFALTYYMTYIYTALTIFVMFHRTDFINLTICIIAIFMLMDVNLIKKHSFRWLVGGIVLSVFYDIGWLLFNHYEYGNETKYDGGVEKNVKKFSLYMSYASLIFRLLVAIIFWKDSMDFEHIIQG